MSFYLIKEKEDDEMIGENVLGDNLYRAVFESR